MAKDADEKRHDLILLLLGFALTTLLGGLLTFSFGYLEDRRILAEQRRTEGTEVFEELSRMMDARLNGWRQVAWAIEDGKPGEVVWAEYEAYRAALRRWNENINRTRSMVCRYFGPELGSVFETSIAPGFSAIQDSLRLRLGTAEYPRPEQFDPAPIAHLADPVNIDVYHFNNQLAERLRAGEIGAEDPGDSCTFRPIPNAG